MDFAFGAVLALAERLTERYRGDNLRVRRLYTMGKVSAVLYCVSAYLLINSSTGNPSDWLAFLMAGAVMQIYCMYVYDYEKKKEDKKTTTNNININSTINEKFSENRISNDCRSGGNCGEQCTEHQRTHHCDGAGVQGVAVSDGYVVTLTDADGNYSFTSQKKTDMCSTRFHEDTSRPLPTISFLNFGSNCRRPMSVPPKPTISHSTRWITTTT